MVRWVTVQQGVVKCGPFRLLYQTLGINRNFLRIPKYRDHITVAREHPHTTATGMILMLQPVSALKFTHSLVGDVRVLEKGVCIEIYGYHFGIIFSQIQRYVAYNIRIVNSSPDRSDKANY